MNEKYEEEIARQFYRKSNFWYKMTNQEKIKYLLDNLNVQVKGLV